MSDIVIKVNNLSKRYYTGSDYEFDLRATLGKYVKSLTRQTKKQETEAFWALKNVSFEVKKGEVFGIIGANGAGKSTLLKILSRIILPTEGTAEIHGRVSSLLEVGTGFHPDLTGRENIYFNGVILGMKRADIKRKFDDIVAFSGIEKFIDTPVKRYSSGMKVRLAFSIAVHLETEVMIIDEVLSVGDAAFRQKSLNAIRGLIKQGRTVLVVSHNTETVQSISDRTCWLSKGKLMKIGSAYDVVMDYLKYTQDQKYTNYVSSAILQKPIFENELVMIREVGVRTCGKTYIDIINEGEVLELVVEFMLKKQVNYIDLGYQITNQLGNILFAQMTDTKTSNYRIGNYRIVLQLPNLPYHYRETFYIDVRFIQDKTFINELVQNVIAFKVFPKNNLNLSKMPGSFLIQDTIWEINKI